MLCHQIEQSERNLLFTAEPHFSSCILECRGICCRNLDYDSVFSLWDFIYILMLRPDIESDLRQRIRSQKTVFLSSCPFLENGVGPCIFPDSIKAQVCIVTFCSDVPGPEIKN